MPLSRRDFIKVVGASAGVILLNGATGAKKVTGASKAATGDKAILYDASKCVGCRACQTACKRWNELPPESVGYGDIYDNPSDLSAKTWTLIKAKQSAFAGSEELLFCKYQCMHCSEAACVEVCPSGALYHNEYGFVTYDKDKCIGCGYCTQYCPFNVPHLDTNRITGMGKMDKCTLCTTSGRNRLAIGKEPACVEACPAGALVFGDRDELIAEGRRRVATLKTLHSKPYPQATLYGEKELGGLHTLYVLLDSPQVYGLPEDPQFPVTAIIQKDVFRPLTWIVWAAAAAGLALNVLVARARQKRREDEESAVKRGPN